MNKPRLSFDLNLVDLAVSGYWFCLACQKITEPTEQVGKGHDGCVFCGSPRIRWHPPVFQDELFRRNPLAEHYRVKLDQAFNECQAALRASIELPSEEHLNGLSRAIVRAHQALSDLSEFEESLRHGSNCPQEAA